jgi:hypothetical protein
MIPNDTLDALTKGRSGFKYYEDGQLMSASGDEAVNLFVLHSLVAYLKLEIKTGMSTVGAANELRKLMGSN